MKAGKEGQGTRDRGQGTGDSELRTPTLQHSNTPTRRTTDMLWFFQILYWFAHWLVNFLIQPDKWYSLTGFMDLALTIVTGFLISVLLTFVYHKYSIPKLKAAALVPVTLFLSTFCGLIFLSAGIYLTYFLTGYEIKIQSAGSWIRVIVLDTYPFIIWSVLYFLYKAWDEWKAEKLRTEKERELAQTAQLEMLRYQLNPHFLFNTLSSLRALIRIEPKAAENMVTRISEFLRYSLSYEDENQVELCREIEIIKHYLEIEKVRFGDKMCVEFDIDEAAEKWRIPVFLIHPLVENAVKHGMHTSPKPLVIRITAKVTDGELKPDSELKIDVWNSGRWHEDENRDKKKGKGLENVRRRLELSYPGNYNFSMEKNDGSVTVRISIKNSQ